MQRPKSTFSPEYKVLLRTLVELRLEMGRTQEDVAKAMKWPQSVVSKCEVGRRRMDIVEVRQYCGGIGIEFPRFAVIYEANLASSIKGSRIKNRTY